MPAATPRRQRWRGEPASAGPGRAGFLGLFGGVPNYQRVVRPIKNGDLWTLTVRNASGGSIVPSVWFSFLAAKDVAAITAALKAR